VSQSNLISDMIATPHQAQIIHQAGTLIFANTAAARLFGFETIEAFVKYAKETALFGSNSLSNIESRTRILNFRCFKGQKKRAHVIERQVDWYGAVSCYVTLKPLANPAGNNLIDGKAVEQPHDETFFVDRVDAAIDWTRDDETAVELKSKAFDFAGTCIKLCDDLKDYADSKQVTLNIEIKPRAQKIFHGDWIKITRAASYMVRHAINRAQEGRVDVTLRAGENRDHIIFEVCDSGTHYTPEDANTLFDRSRLTSNPHQTPHTASSDLSMARCIARFLGGEIILKIHHPSGGLIRMRLPFHQIDQDNLSLRMQGQTHRKLDILVAEDNATSRHVIKVILDALGHRATMVCDGKECIDIFAHARFDVILMDLHMPIQDGYSAIQHIRAREQSGVLLYDKPVPILAMTADRRPEARGRATTCGATGFIIKPIHVPQIMSALAPFIEEVANPLVRQTSSTLASRVA
jgi:CheY-like chemotaxis protein